MDTGASSNPAQPTAAQMRELALRACEVARLAAGAMATGVSSGSAESLEVVRECEEELDSLDRQINEGVTAAIPGASDTDARDLLTALKLVLELERVGDLLLSVANRASAVAARLDGEDAADLKRMAELLEQMLTDALIAFRDRDLQRAMSVLRTDTEVDRIRNLLFVRHIDNPERQPRQASFHLVFMTQTLERAGDHAKNVAEEVTHLVTGRSIRHLIRAADKPVEEMFIDWARRKQAKR